MPTAAVGTAVAGLGPAAWHLVAIFPTFPAAHGPDVVAGTRPALTSVAGVIMSAGVVPAATFGALAVLPLVRLAQRAFLVAFGVLLDALVVRALPAPALTIHKGRTFRWAGGPKPAGRSAGRPTRGMVDWDDGEPTR
ncbi:MMPL family transporter [Saccharothrix hoggarensis]|uniref:MMPL family transporter n=1 Tax=Saccharothrix hoggarensis TaxID=913853 RepID=A0ABW3QRT1_9PSEU